mmetsp:Transcript_7204/g.8349  ORF Transcript_7204/g.8349 Transcript_7204/m.8349 type:complete len:313 (-) Transcript_7204:68-1006(-)
MNILHSIVVLSLLVAHQQTAFGFSPTSIRTVKQTGSERSSFPLQQTKDDDAESLSPFSRRNFVGSTAALALWTGLSPSSAGAAASSSGIATTADGNLPDLPSEAVRSYLQYRIQLQIAADFYIFSVQDQIKDIDQWGDVGQLFQVNNNKGQGQPSKIERDFVNPMRILLLSFPPEFSDDMRDAQFRFERAAGKISKATAGYRRDLPVEVDKGSITNAIQGWDEGRIALNEFFVLLNTAVGLEELTPIPPPGPNQNKAYGRSAARYKDLTKKIKLCQNRGGPALAQTWGLLMTTGYLQDSCGIPDMEQYFRQK